MFDARLFQDSLTTRTIGRSFLYRPLTETTMTLARREADEGAPTGALVLAEEQTAGRGRRGRSFYSPAGENLYFTIVLRPDPSEYAGIPLAVPLAVAAACGDEGVDARIKWPNDIWVGERKLCGMLIDAEQGVSGATVLPGIGINVNGDPTTNPELRDIATSLRRELGHAVSREALLARICNGLEARLALDLSELQAEYEARSMVLGRRIEVMAQDGNYDAQAVRIGPAGQLVVRRDDGRELEVLAADVTVRPRD